MAITNEQIIFNARFELMGQGKIGSTGRMIVMQDDDGNEKEIPEPEIIHTFNGWKERGYKVKKGEHAVAKLGIWKYSEKPEDEDGKEKVGRGGYCFIKQSCFFAASQVEKAG